jgi:hypothetical protein
MTPPRRTIEADGDFRELTGRTRLVSELQRELRELREENKQHWEVLEAYRGERVRESRTGKRRRQARNIIAAVVTAFGATAAGLKGAGFIEWGWPSRAEFAAVSAEVTRLHVRIDNLDESIDKLPARVAAEIKINGRRR